MSVFGKKQNGGGLMDVIRCDEPSYLIWKWHPEGTTQGANRKENSIRFGSSIRVKEGSVAVFVYTQPDGTVQDYIEGPYDGFLETKNLPVLTGLLGLAYGGNTPFQAEVYFINLAQIIQTKFAVPYFDVFDPRYLDFSVPVAVRGTITFKISNYKEFISLHRLENFSLETFQAQIKDAVIRNVKSIVANAPEQFGIPVIQLERKISEINNLAEESLKPRLYKEFGVTVSSIDISAIDIDKSSEGYQKLMAVTQDVMTQTVQASAEVNIKEMRDSQQLSVLERETAIKENAYAQHKQTQSENLSAYQIEAAEHVGVAGAEGMGKMGEGGAGNVGGSGMNPAAMMAGMAIGNAVGQNMAGTMNNMMGNINQQQPQPSSPIGSTPPPVPVSTYFIAVNGQSTGPYDLAAISQMIQSGQFTKDTLVWKQGMSEWKRSEDVGELASVFNSNSSGMPPVPPT